MKFIPNFGFHKKTDNEPPPLRVCCNQEETPAETVASTFVKMSMLTKDTWDAYRMGDSNHVFRIAKMELLYAFGTRQTKYHFCLWNLIAYGKPLLSEREAYEYKWNVSINLHAGIGANIPNDDRVNFRFAESRVS